MSENGIKCRKRVQMPGGVNSELGEISLGRHGSLYGGDARTGNGLQTTKQHVFESAPDKEMRNSKYNDELAAPWDWHMVPIDGGFLNESVSSWIHEGKLDLKLELECQKGESELYSFGNKSIKIVTKAGEW